VGHSEVGVCLRKFLLDSFSIDDMEQFGIVYNPGLLT
jgi:hypothetical protein